MDDPISNAVQVGFDVWPDGEPRPLAVLPWEPEEMPLKFESSYDDLDYIQAANIRAPGGWTFGLRRHRGSPMAGVAVYVVSDDAAMPEALGALIDAVGLDQAQLRWVSPLAFPGAWDQ